MWLAIRDNRVHVMEHEGDYEDGDVLVKIEPAVQYPGVTIEVRPTVEQHWRE